MPGEFILRANQTAMSMPLVVAPSRAVLTRSSISSRLFSSASLSVLLHGRTKVAMNTLSESLSK